MIVAGTIDEACYLSADGPAASGRHALGSRSGNYATTGPAALDDNRAGAAYPGARDRRSVSHRPGDHDVSHGRFGIHQPQPPSRPARPCFFGISARCTAIAADAVVADPTARHGCQTTRQAPSRARPSEQDSVMRRSRAPGLGLVANRLECRSAARRWSPCNTICPSFTVPPAPQAFLSRVARSFRSLSSGARPAITVTSFPFARRRSSGELSALEAESVSAPAQRAGSDTPPPAGRNGRTLGHDPRGFRRKDGPLRDCRKSDCLCRWPACAAGWRRRHR